MLSSITITYTLDIYNTANLQQELSVIHLAMCLDSGYEICTLYSKCGFAFVVHRNHYTSVCNAYLQLYS